MASPEVSEVSVHACTGNPLPSDVEQICQWLFNAPFVQAFHSKCLLTLSAYALLALFFFGCHVWG